MNSTKLTYSEWISENCNDKNKVHRKCEEFSNKIKKKFPELNIVKGHYTDLFLNEKYEHWWLEDTSGKIIDPTCEQFLDKGSGLYNKHTGKEPIGKCINCGDYCYENRYFCCDGCVLQNKQYVNKNKCLI